MTAYKEMHLEVAVPKMTLRPNAKVTLNGIGATPFMLTASTLNCVIGYALLRRRVVEYIPGYLREVRQSPHGFLATFDSRLNSEPTRFDRIVVRHGPAGAFTELFGKVLAGSFLKSSRFMTEAGTAQFWPADYFGLRGARRLRVVFPGPHPGRAAKSRRGTKPLPRSMETNSQALTRINAYKLFYFRTTRKLSFTALSVITGIGRDRLRKFEALDKRKGLELQPVFRSVTLTS